MAIVKVTRLYSSGKGAEAKVKSHAFHYNTAAFVSVRPSTLKKGQKATMVLQGGMEIATTDTVAGILRLQATR